jgi:two-component system phosphate regulon sensor histidine kinase PhoR
LADQGLIEGSVDERTARDTARAPDENAESTLKELDRRRTQLWVLSIALLLASFAGAAFLVFGEKFLPDPLRESPVASYIAAVLVVSVGFAFVLYTAEKESELRRLSRLVLEDRGRIIRLEQLDELRRDFLAVASHDLKTPLTSVIGAAKTLAEHGSALDPETQQTFLQSIERQSMRMLEMIQDVLDTSRIEAGALKLKREQIDLRELVSRLAGDLLGTNLGSGRRLEVRFFPDVPRMWGDRMAVQQILTNLIENAFKYAEDPITVESREESMEVVLSVSDSGPGITEDQLVSLFDRFKTAEDRSPKGFGLGLFIVASLVEAQDGSVSVTSKVGEGTTFTVRFLKRAADRT